MPEVIRKDPEAAILAEALRLHAQGHWVLPVTRDRRVPVIKDWQNRRLERAELERFLARQRLNIALVLTRCRFMDVEPDSPEDEEELLKLLGGTVPPTPTYQSRRGVHRLFLKTPGLPDGGVIKIGKRKSIECRMGNGGVAAFSVIPPSIHHTTGKPYHWLPGLHLDEVEPAELPSALADLLRNHAGKPSKPRPEFPTADGHIPEGARNDTLFRLACKVKSTGLSDDAVRAAIHKESDVRCPHPLPDKEVDTLVLSACARASTSNLHTAEGRTATANAERLIARHGEDIRWVGRWDKFLVWDNTRWRLDESRTIDIRAKGVAQALWDEIGSYQKSGSRTLDEKTFAAMRSHARYSNGRDGVHAMIDLAKGDLAVSFEALDSDPLLLNVGNGTIDLLTGRLREHRRGDMITKLAPVAYDPKVRCPVWTALLNRIFEPHPELIQYIQRLVGYCLTGSTEEQILPFLFGSGANGKSTVVETICTLLGSDYAMKAPPNLLMARKGEAHPTERAALYGKRFVACVETESRHRLAESLVKELTGGDKVSARRMREDFWEFDPTHKLWLAGNHKPVVTDMGHGMWRRIKLIPFDVTIPDHEQDKGLKDKLRAELPGILNWALAGCRKWRREGLQEPAIVRTQTSEYREEMDDVGAFLEDCCDRGGEYTAPSADLYRAFIEASPGAAITQKALGTELKRRGFESIRASRGQRRWKGLRLKSQGGGGTPG